MTNVKTKIEGTILKIEVDLSERHGPSSSGKTTIIASTNGNAKVDDRTPSISFGLNVYVKN